MDATEEAASEYKHGFLKLKNPIGTNRPFNCWELVDNDAKHKYKTLLSYGAITHSYIV
jgi:hypothetical protein